MEPLFACCNVPWLLYLHQIHTSNNLRCLIYSSNNISPFGTVYLSERSRAPSPIFRYSLVRMTGPDGGSYQGAYVGAVERVHYEACLLVIAEQCHVIRTLGYECVAIPYVYKLLVDHLINVMRCYTYISQKVSMYSYERMRLNYIP